MSFTTITVTGSFRSEDGSEVTGSVTATLSCALENGGEIVQPVPSMAVIQAGVLTGQSLEPWTLLANDDVGTVPAGSHYVFAVQVDGSPLVEFDAVVPSASVGGTVDLSVLEPSAS
jgi:hypothetical protein